MSSLRRGRRPVMSAAAGGAALLLAGGLLAGCQTGAQVTGTASTTASDAARTPSPSNAQALPDGVQQTTLPDGTSAVVGWNPCHEITVRWNPGGLPREQQAAVQRDIEQALALTSSASGLRLRLVGATGEVPRHNAISSTADVVIAVVDPAETDLPLGQDGVGYTEIRTWTWPQQAGSPAGAQIGRAAVVLDRVPFMALPAGVTAGQSRGNVLLHELGHAVGLVHTRAPGSLMAPALSNRAAAGWAASDRAALSSLAAAPCRDAPSGVIPKSAAMITVR